MAILRRKLKMNKIKILVEGYAKQLAEGSWEADSTVTLIESNNIRIIVDPGMNRNKLLSALNKEGLKPRDIDYVVLTHNHIDHMLLTGIFENASVIDDSAIYSFDGKSTDHNGKIPGTDIQIICTPGHDQFHCSVLVNTKERGKIVVAGDVFWWRSDEDQKLDHKDPYVKDEKALAASRRKILELANWVIPGHGKMFEVKNVEER